MTKKNVDNMPINENIGLNNFNFFKYKNNSSIPMQTHRDTWKELHQQAKGEYIIRITVYISLYFDKIFVI